MPWYRIKANTGPGHQSRRLEYVYRADKLSKADKTELFDEMCQHEWCTDNAIGDVRAVARLPEKVRLEKLQEYQSRRDSALRMIIELKRMGLR